MADILPYSLEGAEDVGARLRRGEVGIFPCDTIYGLCGRADERIAERLYEIKRRPASKSFITLMDKFQMACAFHCDSPGRRWCHERSTMPIRSVSSPPASALRADLFYICEYIWREEHAHIQRYPSCF